MSGTDKETSYKVDLLNKVYCGEFYTDSFHCPSCHEYSLDAGDNYCRECGAMLDWSEPQDVSDKRLKEHQQQLSLF